MRAMSGICVRACCAPIASQLVQRAHAPSLTATLLVGELAGQTVLSDQKAAVACTAPTWTQPASQQHLNSFKIEPPSGRGRSGAQSERIVNSTGRRHATPTAAIECALVCELAFVGNWSVVCSEIEIAREEEENTTYRGPVRVAGDV